MRRETIIEALEANLRSGAWTNCAAQMGECLAYLRALCDFSIGTVSADSINLDVDHLCFDSFEYGRDNIETTDYYFGRDKPKVAPAPREGIKLDWTRDELDDNLHDRDARPAA